MKAARGHAVTLMSRAEETLLEDVRKTLTLKFQGIRGIRLEPKEAGIAVHYRDASRREIEIARAAVKGMLAANRRLHLLVGKKVWEILPGPGVDKWTAMRFLLALENHADSLLIYVGDDATDEYVFSRMRGISIVVGKRRRTAAKFFVEPPSDVRRLLEELVRTKR